MAQFVSHILHVTASSNAHPHAINIIFHSFLILCIRELSTCCLHYFMQNLYWFHKKVLKTFFNWVMPILSLYCSSLHSLSLHYSSLTFSPPTFPSISWFCWRDLINIESISTYYTFSASHHSSSTEVLAINIHYSSTISTPIYHLSPSLLLISNHFY